MEVKERIDPIVGSVDLPEKTRANLLKLKEKLETVHSRELGFDMVDLIKVRRNDSLYCEIPKLGDFHEQFKECNTVACALGWAMAVEGMQVTEDDFKPESSMGREFNINSYTDRVFPNLPCLVHVFLFEEEWDSVDNTALGASKRCAMVANGHYVINWDDADKDKLLEIIDSYSK